MECGLACDNDPECDGFEYKWRDRGGNFKQCRLKRKFTRKEGVKQKRSWLSCVAASGPGAKKAKENKAKLLRTMPFVEEAATEAKANEEKMAKKLAEEEKELKEG